MIIIEFEVPIVWVDDEGNPVSPERIAALIPRNQAWDDEFVCGGGEE